MLKTIRKHGITLALFAAGSTGLTAAINQMTKTTIAEQASLQQKALFDQVLPAERYNNALAQSCYLVTAPELGKGEHRVYIAKQDDKPVAAVLETTAPDGYSGAIQLLVGADFNGTVLFRGCGKTTLRWSSCSAFVRCWRSRPLPLTLWV